jgi:uncharacterized SAM-binding protein YcdF (DUF218 family)
MDASSPTSYQNDQYSALLGTARSNLAASGHKQLIYKEFGKADPDDFATFLEDVDCILCLGRDVTQNPEYSDDDSRHNIALTPSAISNVRTSLELLAQIRRPEVPIIFSGGINNRYLDTYAKLPELARLVGAESASTLLEMSEAEFEVRLHQAAQLNDEERSAILQEFKEYPRISEAEILAEYAERFGLPEERMLYDDTSVDTISSIVNVLEIMQRHNYKRVLIVSTKDHLPRTLWVSDFIFSDDYGLGFYETDPCIPLDQFTASCERELKSLLASIKWIGDTDRALPRIKQKIYDGYFNPATRRSATQISAQVRKQ